MEIGISLACFYPAHPEEVIAVAADLGFHVAEVFLNTYSELDRAYLEDFSRRCSVAGIEIYSVHPFTSALENYLFFSPYDRRIADAVTLYERYCDAADILGAKLVNIHGDRGLALTDFDKYVECLAPLAEISARRGVIMSHENVFYNSINHPEIASRLVSKLGDGIKFTFDIKQAHKGESDPYELCEAMGKNVINDEHICMLPGRGVVDHTRLFETLKRNGYQGPALIEVYRTNFTENSELVKAAEYLRSIQ